MTYNPTTYFKDRNNLVHKYRISDMPERIEIEEELRQLDLDHLKHISIAIKDL